MRRRFRAPFEYLRQLQRNVDDSSLPPLEGTKPRSEKVIDLALVSGTKPYLEKVADQINGTYENGWYDACGVMLRRFIETLIIETYIAKNRESNIKNANGDFVGLRQLIDMTCSDTDLNLSRNTKKILPRLKKLGDLSAHNRTFVAKRTYIESLFEDMYLDMQTMIQDFIHEAGFK